MTSAVKWAAFVLVAVMLGLQVVRPAHTNPATDPALTLERTVDVPPDVLNTFASACNDCHSNQTNWRWYTYVAPISWFTVSDVNRGRAELNISVWGSYRARMRETRLRAICELARKRRMPLPAYALVHREANLSSSQITALCEWTAHAAPATAR